MDFVVIAFLPLMHLVYFQVFRYFFKKWKGTEPYVTGRGSLGGNSLLIYSLQRTYTEIGESSMKIERSRRPIYV
jgi:hypothetical protein